MEEATDICKGVVFNGVETLQYVDVEKPRLRSEKEALLKVVVCGICGSDLHPYHGREPCALKTVFGHECVGEVVALGCDVSSVIVGDTVVVPFSTACGKCYYCNNDLSARCSESQLFGWKDPDTDVGIHGAQSEYVTVPNANGSLYHVPVDFTPEEGLLLGDILSTALYAACQAGLCGYDDSGNSVSTVLSLASRVAAESSDMDAVAPIQKKETSSGVYAVVGCGPVGLLTVAAVRALLVWRGWAPNDVTVYAIDTVDERLSHAARWGAIPLKLDVEPPDTSLPAPSDKAATGYSSERIKSIISEVSKSRGRSGRGVDAIIECVGSPSALRLAYDLLAPGGALSSVGVHSTTFPFTPSDVYDKNITYRSGRCPARSMMPAAEVLLRWLRDSPVMRESAVGNIRLADIVTHRKHLSEAVELYEIFDKKREGCLKPVLYPFEVPRK